MKNNIEIIVKKQRDFFNSGKTRELEYRKQQLKKLKKIIINNESQIYEALSKDLNKPQFEAYTSEIMPAIAEVNHAIKNLKKWIKPVKVKTPVGLAPAKSEIYSNPYGVVLNIAPWNYPFQLCISLLIPILASGNCAIIKPSEFSVHTSALVNKMINENFSQQYCAVVEGGIETTQELLRQKWDFIVFTGSSRVGRIVNKAASDNLTPVLLELGGKSPCVVHKDADIKIAAKRISWGKFSNAGQTCTAPDYILAHKNISKELIKEIKIQIKSFYSDNPQNSPDFARIINEKHFKRLESYLSSNKRVFGGYSDVNSLYIEPTLFTSINWDDDIMQEEIFGPLLPVIEYDNIDEIVKKIQQMEHSLAFYLFTKDKKIQDRIINSISFGGGCINATLIHSANANLPFGGVGNSGMGRYHGKIGFDTFSYKKSIMKKPTWIDPQLVYPPYKDKLKIAKLFG